MSTAWLLIYLAPVAYVATLISLLIAPFMWPVSPGTNDCLLHGFDVSFLGIAYCCDNIAIQTGE